MEQQHAARRENKRRKRALLKDKKQEVREEDKAEKKKQKGNVRLGGIRRSCDRPKRAPVGRIETFSIWETILIDSHVAATVGCMHRTARKSRGDPLLGIEIVRGTVAATKKIKDS